MDGGQPTTQRSSAGRRGPDQQTCFTLDVFVDAVECPAV
eukprot:SAG31_NODE_46931_length_252_cov_0.790850_1_plen_38_part_10